MLEQKEQLSWLPSTTNRKRRRAPGLLSPLTDGLPRRWESGYIIENRSKRRMVYSRLDFTKDRIEKLTEKEFIFRYKLNKKAFMWLVEKLDPYISKDSKQQKRSSGSEISLTLMVSVTLRYLCGGHIADIQDLHNVSRAQCYHIINDVVEAINRNRKYLI